MKHRLGVFSFSYQGRNFFDLKSTLTLMMVTIDKVQLAFLGGINHAMGEKLRWGDAAPQFLADNIQAGCDVLQQIGLGRELADLKGPVRMLAIRQQLPMTPTDGLAIADYLKERGHAIASLLYALHYSLPQHEARMELGALSVFSDDKKISALFTAGMSEDLKVTPVLIDAETRMDVHRFSEEFREATLLWALCVQDLRDIDVSLSPRDRALTGRLVIVEYLKQSSIKRVAQFANRVTTFQKRYPNEFPIDQIDAYHASRAQLKEQMICLLREYLPARVSDRLDAESWNMLSRLLWRDVAAQAFHDEHDVWALRVYDNEMTHALGGRKIKDAYPHDHMFLIMLELVARAKAGLSWKNLWGNGWNPLHWRR